MRGSSSSGIPTPVSRTVTPTWPSLSCAHTRTSPPSGVYFTALSRSMESACRTRLRSKTAKILRFKLEWSPFVAASQGKQFLSQVPHAPRLFPNRLHTFSGGFWILDRPFLEHLCVALDVGKGGSEFVAGVCDKTSLFPKRLLATGEGLLQTT